MKYLIGEISKFWWIAAVVVASSCAPVTGHQLKGLADTSLAKGQIAGTSGGNPALEGLAVEGKDPKGSVSELALCIAPGTLAFLSGDTSEETKTATLLPIANARVDLVNGQLVIDVQGLAIPAALTGVEFDLLPVCGDQENMSPVGESSALVSNLHGTIRTSQTVHVTILGGTQLPVSKNTVQLTLLANDLLQKLADATTEDDLIKAFNGTTGGI